jgi:hypothetical protein
MEKRLPPWVTAHAKAKEEEEIREYASLSPEERLERFCQISRLSWALFSQNPRREEALAQRDERSPESLALWRRLMRERRRG